MSKLKNFIDKIVRYLNLKRESHTTNSRKIKFARHNTLLSKQYKAAQLLTVAQISDELLTELNKYIQQVGTKSIMSIAGESTKKSHLIIDNHTKQIIQDLELNLKAHPISVVNSIDNPIKALHKELRNIFSNHINSPFAFVNSRAWSTKPCSAEVGPNIMHTDGFAAGHLKIMVYLTPLNHDYGYFVAENNPIVDHPAGTCICFANSDLLHRGVPGIKFDRTCIEVTIMRSFMDAPQLKEGHFFGRHYRSPDLYEMLKLE